MPEEKTPEALEMQRKADELERVIVRFTNIDNESFTHSFRGISITVGAGQSLNLRLPEADHLATHLARKILSRRKKAEPNQDKIGNLWTEKEITDMKEKILSPLGTEETGSISPEEARKRDVEALQTKFSPDGSQKEPVQTKVSKRDVITDLEGRGVKVDVSKSKEELLEQVMALESKGIEPSVE